MKSHAIAVLLSVTGFVAGLVPQSCRAQEPQNNYPPVPIEREYYAWTGHLNYVLGYKRLPSAWRPAADQVEFGLLDCDFRLQNWPVSVAGQLLLSYSDDIPNQPGFIGNQSGTYEFNLGLRKVWDTDRSRPLQPFVGGGTSTWVTFDTGDSATVQEENDTNIGFWVGGGCYWLLNRHFHVGVTVQYSRANIELFGKTMDAGGLHALLMLGCHW